ncbi:putative ABC transporter, permease [Nostocoides japonicum T1-X7]|uniref:Putative ABC transporter, permease n=1 Tax=Nostocoides japonicum T1-X7 TaxID=1194083 RepID=A0A077LXG9_9MICO|nr:ABC transporter permease [Tetrasphaera japonica]CCH76669.1 putative ABC transporter, permease [Tetrasphaera japonica T1-X7]
MTATTVVIESVGIQPRRRLAVIVSIVIVALLVVAVVASPFLQDAALHQDILSASLSPGAEGHPLGTDQLGRDVLLLTIAGTASAIVGPVVIAVGSMLLGILFGTLSGYRGGLLDGTVGRVTDILLALPVLLAAIVIGGVFGGGYWSVAALLVVLFCPTDIRIIRSAVIEQAPRPYVEAAQMLSLSRRRIMFGHILPNVRSLVITNMLLNVGFAMVTLSSLSYLGVGVRPGSADWGRQISDGREIMFTNPAAVLAPALLLIIATCAITVLGDWVGDRLAGDDEA